jgi:hypothetical protein
MLLIRKILELLNGLSYMQPKIYRSDHRHKITSRAIHWKGSPRSGYRNLIPVFIMALIAVFIAMMPGELFSWPGGSRFGRY